MKQPVILTGVANEHDIETGETKFLLVFNGGKLRVPVQQPAVQAVLEFSLGQTTEEEDDGETRKVVSDDEEPANGRYPVADVDDQPFEFHDDGVPQV